MKRLRYLLGLSVLLPVRAARPQAPDAPVTLTAVFAGGCFWGVDAVFKHVRGVVRVVSGYAGGGAATALYPVVSTGLTGHAESVEVTYDSTRITYRQLLEVFFAVAHDPTQLNRQGPDEGSQYRSAIFYMDDAQRREAQAYIAQLTHGRVYDAPIVTQVVALERFYPAEAYHQDYVKNHPDNTYVVTNALPKLRKLKGEFPTLLKK